MNLRNFLKMTHFKFSKLVKTLSWAMIFVIGTMATGAYAQVLIEDDFETSEGFTTGVLDSQLGWTSSGAVVVDTTGPYSGTQLVWLPLDEIKLDRSLCSIPFYALGFDFVFRARIIH